ncbi:flagellar protein FlaG [Bacillus marinisedimentorum]|uniref:flagellar protein FlaG n=1 Tax=Bacillus marinisedimentorum TaxID=1821260 RepID=UPI0007E0088D|nr:flagellar protein FlaG [Bacillus marinisedimentorum]
MIEHISSQGVSQSTRLTSLETSETLRMKGEGEAGPDIQKSVDEKAAPVKEASKEQLEEVVKGLNEFLQPSHTYIQFELHEKLNEYYVTVVDEVSKEVVREIPAKKMLDFYAAMTEFVGLVVDKKI